MELKCKDYSVTQILREINFGNPRSSNLTDFFNFRGFEFVDLVNFSFKKCNNSQISKNSES